MRVGINAVVATIAAVLWAGAVLAQTQGGPLPSPLPLFPATNWWNLDISTAPVDPSSASFISFIGGDQVHPDFGGTVGGNPATPEIYGFPYIVVNGTQPKKTVTFVAYGSESDGVGVPFYPIPDQAITTAHWIEGGPPGNQDPGGDRHMLIVDQDNKYLYELYNVFYNGSNWEAASGAFFDMKTNNRRPEGWTSADAAGLAILPGLIRYDEAYTNPGPIKHAFRVTMRLTNGYVFPASHAAGSTSGALPMGARLRLKAGKTVTSADVGVQRIVQAMKTYGLIVADNGTDMFVSGTFDTRWDNDMLNPALGQINANDFEVIKLGLLPAADLAITKTDGRTASSPGQPTTYTIVATNGGPEDAVGAKVTDTVPASLIGASWMCAGTNGGVCTAAGGPNISDTVTLPVGGSVTYTLSGTVAASPASLRNTATVTVPTGMLDPNSENNSATDDDLLLCFGEKVVVPDGRITPGTIAASATAWFAASLKIGNSYSVEMKSPAGTSAPGTLSIFSGDDGCSGTSTLGFTDTSSTDPPSGALSRRLSFTAAGTARFFRARIVNGTPSPIPLTVSWSDTTLYSPAWSTNGAFNTYYSFQNTTGSTVKGRLTLLDTSGAVLFASDPLSIPAGQALSTNTSTLVVTRGRSGTARFAHDGPPGAVTAEAAIANFSLTPAYVQPVKFQAVRDAR
jgi:uncharacterized repeat protein (TIGR01451 family)